MPNQPCVVCQGMAQLLVSCKDSIPDSILAARSNPIESLLTKRQREVRFSSALDKYNFDCAGRSSHRGPPLQGEVSFGLAGLESVEQAVSLFKDVDVLPNRRWAGDEKQRTKHCSAFVRFRDGLLKELLLRAAVMGEVRATADLEKERLAVRAKGNHSQLQILANQYRKLHRAAATS